MIPPIDAPIQVQKPEQWGFIRAYPNPYNGLEGQAIPMQQNMPTTPQYYNQNFAGGQNFDNPPVNYQNPMYAKQVPEECFDYIPELGKIDINIHDESRIHISDPKQEPKEYAKPY